MVISIYMDKSFSLAERVLMDTFEYNDYEKQFLGLYRNYCALLVCATAAICFTATAMNFFFCVSLSNNREPICPFFQSQRLCFFVSKYMQLNVYKFKYWIFSTQIVIWLFVIMLTWIPMFIIIAQTHWLTTKSRQECDYRWSLRTENTHRRLYTLYPVFYCKSKFIF